MENYHLSSHCRFSLKYHFVWVTKHRKAILTGEVGLRLREMVRQICLQNEVEILQGAVCKDHVHVLLSCLSNISLGKLIRLLKGRTSRKLMTEFKHLKRMYWGRPLWTRGYFVTSSGTVTDDVIEEYIRLQESDRPSDNDENFRVN